MAHPTRDVMVENLVERRESTVVHIWSALGNIPEGWNLKHPAIGRVARLEEASGIYVRIFQPVVGKAVGGEMRGRMAVDAGHFRVVE